jgi:hypothetical protein
MEALHRVTAEMITESEQHLRVDMRATEQRLYDRLSATERRFTDLLNERLDAVMVALDPVARSLAGVSMGPRIALSHSAACLRSA